MIRSRSLVWLTVAALLATCMSCGGPTPTPSTTDGGNVELTIFGAASLGKALEEVKTAYEMATPGITLRLSTDSSAALATQIQQGAPADVFLSADTTNPQKLVDGGFAEGAPMVFAGNKLCVITPMGDPAHLASPFALARLGIRVIAAGDEVPITKYATQLVENLTRHPGAPPGFAAGYASNIASKEDNVRAVVAKIELGEGDAAIVYVTDAAASDQVTTIAIPDDVANVPATYAGVVVKASRNQPAATAFLDWVAGPEGQAILATFGFLPPAA